MGMDIPTLVERVKAEPHYQILFEKAYGDNQITSNRIFSTLQGFMSAIYSANTRFDKIFKQPENTSLHSNFKNFTSSENQGKKLFIDNCGSCHGGSLTTSFGANPNVANSGLDIIYEDKGVGSVTLNTDDNGKFKVPSLRNIEVTYPYMHDGRFETLEEVIDFYSTNIQPHPNLTEKLKNLDGTPKQFNFSNSDRKNLVDFLETLTDHELLMNPKYSDPFKH